MKWLRCLGLLSVFVLLVFLQGQGMEKKDGFDGKSANHNTIIEVVDSLMIGLSKVDTTICVDDKVVLSFNTDSVFACEWIEAATGKIISTDKVLTLSPDSTSKYRVNLYYFTGELIKNGDFEDVSLPENKRVDTEYKFVETVKPNIWEDTKGNVGQELWDEGTYRIGKSPRTFHPNFYRITDHTSGKGNMMIVNGSPRGNVIVWRQTVDVVKGEIYAFSTWGVEIARNNPAQFHFTINGKILGQNDTLQDNSETEAKWEQFYELWEADTDKAVISLVNLNTERNGNDFAIDDISFASMTKKQVEITIKVLPRIDLGKFKDNELCEGESLPVYANTIGSGNLEYVWKKGDAVLEEKGAMLKFTSLKPEDSGTYSCIVTGECGLKTENFQIKVREKLRLAQLQDTVRPCEEATVTFSAGATGYLPKYNWTCPEGSRGWEGGKTASYTNEKIYWYRDTGTYTCRITTQCGEGTVYRVLKPAERIKITDWPGDQKVCRDGDLSLTVGTNVEPRQVKWEGTGLANPVDTKTVELKNVTENHAGVYHCMVQDDCLKEEERFLKLSVVPPLTMLEVSPDTVVCENTTAILRAKADGLKTRYEWTGPDGFSARTATIMIHPVTPERVGIYRVVAIDSCGNTLTGQVNVSLLDEFGHIEISPGMRVCPDTKITLEVSGGQEGLLYNWTLPDGTRSDGTLLNVKALDGQYICEITGTCGSVVKSVNVALKQTLKASAGVNNFKVCPGEPVSFVPVLSGENIHCEWWKEGNKVGEGRFMTLEQVKSSDAGHYECRITSDCGNAILTYDLQVKELLQIVSYSAGKYVRRGEKATLLVNVSGDNDRTYEWFLGGKPLTGENSNKLQIQAPQEDGTLMYRFRVKGCNTEEIEIPVQVRDYIEITKDTNIRLCPGSDYSYRVPAKPEDWCKDSEMQACWVYNGKDTVSRGNAITFTGFANHLVGEYVYTVSSDCGKETLTLQVDSMKFPEIIAIHAEGGTEKEGELIACLGGDIRLIPEAKTYGAVIYEWSKNGVIIPGATTSVLSLKEVTSDEEGLYACRIISTECGEALKEIRLKVYKNLSVSYGPDIEKCPGESVRMEVVANASVASEFIWSGPDSEGWIAENDGYTAGYKNRAVRAESDGVYQCKVLNVCGEETVQIRLAVEKEIPLPDMAERDTLCPGERVEIHLAGEQTGAKYTWTLPDQSIIEDERLLIEHFSEADTGTYHYSVKTKNNCFSSGGDITLVMRPEMKVLQISPDTAVCSGDAVRFKALAEGKGIEYEWWGPQGKHQMGAQIEIDPVTEKTTGIYEVVITDMCNKTGKRERITLSLKEEFNDLVMSPDTGVCPGSDVQLKACSSREGLVYEWKRNESVVGHEAVLALNQVSQQDSGKYICRITGTCQSVEKEIHLEIFPLLKAEKLDYLPVCVREDAILMAQAIGEKVKYRWMKEGEERGYRTNELVLNDVIPADTGLYICEVSSLCGDTTLSYQFQLKEHTQILHHSADRILCEKDEYTLRVEAAGENNSYTWTCDGKVLPGTAESIQCVAPAQADTLIYKCRVEGDCGTDSATIIIKVGEYRKLRSSRNDSLCEGSNYKYNVDVVPDGAFEGQGFNYRWTFQGQELRNDRNSVFALTALTPEQAGDYHCEITTLPDASAFKSAEIVLHVDVIRLPGIESITEDIYAVEGSSDSVKVVAKGDLLSYSWTKDGVLTANDSTAWYFMPFEYEDRGAYEVTVANRCSHVTARTNVEVWKKTVIVFPQERSDSVCMGGKKELEVVAWGEKGLLYKWYLNGELKDVPFTQPLVIDEAATADTGLYLCVVTGRGGTDSCKIHLKVMDLPDARIEGDFRMCRNESDMSRIYVGGSDQEWVKLDWQVTGGQLVNSSQWRAITVEWDPASEGSLTLEVTSLISGCSKVRSKEIEYSSVPDLNLVVPDRVGYCQDTLKLDRAYPWGGTFRVNGEDTDVVKFTHKDISYQISYFYTDPQTGCSDDVSDTIKVAAPPVIRLSQDSIRMGWCAPVDLEVSKHSEGNIAWSEKDKLKVINDQHAVFQAEAYTEEILKFHVSLTDSFQCQAVDSASVLLLPSPVVALGKDTLVGVCNELILRGESNTEHPRQIEWLPATKLKVLEEYSAEMTDHSEGAKQFQLVVTDQYGCVGKDTIEVTVVGAPIIEDREICAGDAMTIDVSEYHSFIWQDGYEGNVRVLTASGIFDLQVADSYGCTEEATFIVHALPEIHLQDTVIYEGQKFDFVVEAPGDYFPYEMVWQDGSRGDTYTAEAEGYYRVKVMDNMGCTAVDSAYLTVKKWYIAAPDAFLPASGGENSRFYLKEVNFGSHFEMFIYDRWGELLFKTNEIGFKGGWDGSFKGMKCQPGAYVWVAFVDGKEVGRGTLVLVK